MKENNLTFEQNLIRLEQIVRTMEKGEASLDEALKLFQEGTDLARQCEKQLDDAELQVTKVLSGDDGQPIEEVFVHDGDI